MKFGLFLVLSASCFSAFGSVVPRVQSFLDHELVPDILSVPPKGVLSVTFPNGVEAMEGNELTPEEVVGVPTLGWNVNPNNYYTVVMCDADAPSRVDPTARCYLHWLVVNVPGDDIASGDTIVFILNSHPQPETGFHRYVFLVYEQPKDLEFEELPDDSFEGRHNFMPDEFAARYKLGVPVAGNFYQTQTIEDK